MAEKLSARTWVGIFLAVSAVGTIGKFVRHGFEPSNSVELMSEPVVELMPLPSATEDRSPEGVRLAAQVSRLGMPQPIYKLADRPGGAVFYLEVSGAEALTRWRMLRGAVVTTGRYPIVLGDGRGLETARMWTHFAKSPAEILDESRGFDVEKWLGKYVPRQPLSGDLELADGGPEEPLAVTLDPNNDEVLDRVAIALVPTVHSWKVPAWLGIGAEGERGWRPAIHVGILKRWFDQHRAELVAVDAHALEMVVAAPVVDPGQAWLLAEEQRVYADDGAPETLPDHAAQLRASRVWSFFWFD